MSSNRSKRRRRTSILSNASALAECSLVHGLFFRALERVQALVAEYEAAKKQETERRAAYKNEKNELENEINKLEARLKASSDTDPADSGKWKEIDEQYQLVSDRLQKQRLVMVRSILPFTSQSVRVVSSLGEKSP